MLSCVGGVQVRLSVCRSGWSGRSVGRSVSQSVSQSLGKPVKKGQEALHGEYGCSCGPRDEVK